MATVRFDNFSSGYSPEPIENNQMLNIQNMRVNRQGFLESREGYQKVCSSSMARITGIARHGSATTPYFIVCCSDGKVYSVTDAGVRATLGTLTASDNLWNFASYNDSGGDEIVIGVNGANVPKKFTKAGAMDTLGGSPPSAARSVFVYKGCVFMDNGGIRWYYSTALNPETGWSSYLEPIVSKSDLAINAAFIGSTPYLFHEETVWGLFGNVSDDFYLSKKATVGCISRHSIASDGTGIFFISNGGNLLRISPGGVENAGLPVQSITRKINYEDAFGFWNGLKREYWLAYHL